jgi:hypothetical protein
MATSTAAKAADTKAKTAEDRLEKAQANSEQVAVESGPPLPRTAENASAPVERTSVKAPERRDLREPDELSDVRRPDWYVHALETRKGLRGDYSE